MRKLHSLKSDGLHPFWRCTPGRQVTQTGSAVTTGAKVARWQHVFYPQETPRAIEVRTQFVPGGPGPMVVELPPYFAIIDDDSHFSYISRMNSGNHVKSSSKLRLRAKRVNQVAVRYASGAVTVKLNDDPPLRFRSAYRPDIDLLCLQYPLSTRVKTLEVLGTPTAQLVLPKRSRDFAYHVTIDFPDDIIPAPYTGDMLDELMRRCADMGARRVYWIYYGPVGEETWRPSGPFAYALDEHIAETQRHLGRMFLRRASKAAHAQGLDIYAIIKPFDPAWNITLTPDSPEAQRYGQLDVLGGSAFTISNWAADHPEAHARLRPSGKGSRRPIARIDLTAAHDDVTLPEDITLWTSENNAEYQRHPDAFRVRRRGRRITLDGLDIRSPFLAVQTSAGPGRRRFVNTLDNLVKLYDDRGDEAEFTYGLTVRRFRQFAADADHLCGVVGYVGGDFTEDGFFFDHWPGVPSAVFCGDKARVEACALDNEHGVLGIARGRNPFIPGLLCPSGAPARKFWLGRIGQALDCGVDGVDIRWMHHCNVLRFADYGFNPAAVREFKKRHGVDVRSEAFDMESWRRCRGDFYTRFLQQARKLTHDRGKKLQLHISDLYEGTPDTSTPEEIHWDWRRWLKEELCDSVTFKAGSLDAYRNSMGRELIRTCQQMNMPVFYSPFIHRVAGVLSRRDWKSYLARAVRNSGVSGFVVYEAAHIFVAQRRGVVHDVEPGLTGHIRQLAQRELDGD